MALKREERRRGGLVGEYESQDLTNLGRNQKWIFGGRGGEREGGAKTATVSHVKNPISPK